MKWITPVFMSFLAVGCSSITSHFTSSERPVFIIDEALVVKAQNMRVQGRGPASVSEEKEIESMMNDVTKQEGRALRRVYFSLLYQQYHQLSFLMKTKTDIKFCPQFHSDKATMDDELKYNSFKGDLFKMTEADAIYFPETHLQEKSSTKIFLSEVKKELTTLCEEGITDDYYKLENIVSYHGNRESFHRSPESMSALLKIPVFAHLYYLKTVQAPFSVAHTEFNKHEKELLDRTGAKWVHQYVVEVRKKRLSIVESAMLTN